ncbi:MAG: hypothetical protein HY720_31740 [Planctomycetes bacterium]|nr:hypothetical protein [Planctomycetota bacterium]
MPALRRWIAAFGLFMLSFAFAEGQTEDSSLVDEAVFLAQSGFSEEEVIARIREKGGLRRRLTADEAARLRGAGLGERAIAALLSGGPPRLATMMLSEEEDLWFRIPRDWNGEHAFGPGPRAGVDPPRILVQWEYRYHGDMEREVWGNLRESPGLPVKRETIRSYKGAELDGWSYELIEPALREFEEWEVKHEPAKGCTLVWVLGTKEKWYFLVAFTSRERLSEDRPIFEEFARSARTTKREAVLSFVEDLVKQSPKDEAVAALAGCPKLVLDETEYARLARAGAPPEVIASVAQALERSDGEDK